MSQPLPLIDESEKREFLTLLTTKYRSFLRDRHFEIDVSVGEGCVLVTVTLSNPDGSFVYPVEGRLNEGAEELSQKEAAHFLVNYIDLYFEEFLTGGEELLIPIDWTNYEWDAVDFQLRGQIVNRRLEELADQWIANGQNKSHGPRLVDAP